jgi:hypothetical protein
MQASHGPTQTDVVKALMAMAAIYEKALSQDAADMLISDLAEYDPAKILAALRVCRLELNRFPTTAEIIKRMSVKSDSTQVQDIVGSIFKAISWYGYNNQDGAREMIGEVGWKAVQYFGGWRALCDSPSDDASTIRAQLRRSVEAAVEEKFRCDIIGIEFEQHRQDKLGPYKGLQKLDFSGFLPNDKEPA